MTFIISSRRRVISSVYELFNVEKIGNINNSVTYLQNFEDSDKLDKDTLPLTSLPSSYSTQYFWLKKLYICIAGDMVLTYSTFF